MLFSVKLYININTAQDNIFSFFNSFGFFRRLYLLTEYCISTTYWETMRFFGYFLTTLVICILATAEACSFMQTFPCKNITCPSSNGGKQPTCKEDSSYYCDNRIGQICTPVAVCSDTPDPCKNFTCDSGSMCVRVPNNCVPGSPCSFKAQCNTSHRPGGCPNSRNATIANSITSCQNTCEASDHMCEKGYVCCFVKSLRQSFCIPPPLN